MHGKVTVWHMTEEERLDYIEKHPIVPTEIPSGTAFSKDFGEERRKNLEKNKGKEVKKEPTVMDKVDKEELHIRFMAGEPLGMIAESFDVTLASLGRYISDQRKINPEKWPYRR